MKNSGGELYNCALLFDVYSFNLLPDMNASNDHRTKCKFNFV
jgi:hypothetical protein